MSAKSFKLPANSPNMELIREIAKPIYLKELADNGISLRDAAQRGWGFSTFCQILAEDLKIADARN